MPRFSAVCPKTKYVVSVVYAVESNYNVARFLREVCAALYQKRASRRRGEFKEAAEELGVVARVKRTLRDACYSSYGGIWIVRGEVKSLQGYISHGNHDMPKA